MTEQTTIESERGVPALNERTGKNSSMVVLLISGLALGALLLSNSFMVEAVEDKKKDESNRVVRNTLSKLPDPPRPPEIKAEKPPRPAVIRTDRIAPARPVVPERVRKEKKKGPTPFERKMMGSLSSGGTSAMSTATSHNQQAPSQAQGMDGNFFNASDDVEMANGNGINLNPTRLSGSRASLMTDRHMMITRGTYLDCALETAISTDVGGFTSCRMTRDIYSSDGSVRLIEAGSKVVGEYQSGIKDGRARLFVLWTRIETPLGVMIDIDSPGTDRLGRSGHTGNIDTHFWQRFGVAMLLSLVDDAGAYYANKNQNGEVTFNSTSDTAESAAQIALKHYIDIPPTLVKNQGEHIGIFVARDIDFRGVYELELAH